MPPPIIALLRNSISVPCRAVPFPSFALLMPVWAVLCLCCSAPGCAFAPNFCANHGSALLLHRESTLRMAGPLPCIYTPRILEAALCLSVALLYFTKRCLCFSLLGKALLLPLGSSLDYDWICFAYPSPCGAVHCHCYSSHGFAVAPLCCALPLLFVVRPRVALLLLLLLLRSAVQCCCLAQLCISTPFHAVPVHRSANPGLSFAFRCHAARCKALPCHCAAASCVASAMQQTSLDLFHPVAEPSLARVPPLTESAISSVIQPFRQSFLQRGSHQFDLKRDG